MSITIKDIDLAWERFDRVKEQAEQHDFAELAFWTVKLLPYYKDLHENWDEHHAEVFMKYMKLVLKKFGGVGYETNI